MARVKNRLTINCVLVALLWLATAVIGCTVSRLSPGLHIVPVDSFATIAGEWEGVSQTVPEMRNDAAVVLIIREQGRFNFFSNRRTDALVGTGTLTIVDGTVVATGNHGAALLTLHGKADGWVLVVQAALTNGHHYYIEMTRGK